MNRMRAVVWCLMALSMVALISGCESIDRGYEGVVATTDPDRARLQTKVRWLNPQPRIRPVSADQMYVYSRMRNSAGADIDEFGFEDGLNDALERHGYRLTRNIDEAQFILNADLRFLGDAADKRFDAVVGGAAVGAGAGAVIGHNVGKNNTGGGALIGAAAGALLGDIIANRNKQRIYTLVVDVSLGERIRGGVNTTRGTEAEENVRSSTGVTNTGGSYEAGSARSGSSESQSVQLQEDFLYHDNRVIASAERLNLTLPEAEPPLTDRLTRAIAGALP